MKFAKVCITLLILEAIICLLCICAKAQTNTNTPSLPWYQTLYNTVNQSGISTSSNIVVAGYGTYAPNVPAGHRWGGGIFAAYNLNDFIAPSIDVDYLGQFSAVSGTLTLQLPTTPLAFLGAWGTNIVVTPETHAGLGAALGGTSQSGTSAIASVGGGGGIQFGHVLGGRMGLGYDYSTWSGAGFTPGRDIICSWIGR